MKSMIIALAILSLAATAFAHPGGMAKDGCHKDNAANERHWHFDGPEKERGGPCVKVEGKTQLMMAPECPACEPVEVVREVKDVNVQEFEAAMARVMSGIEAALDRPARVVEVEVEVPSLKPTTEQCIGLREQFKAQYDTWGSESERTAMKAIEQGCW